MTLPIPLDQVNQAGYNQRTAQQEALRKSYSNAIAAYKKAQQGVAFGTKLHGADYAAKTYGAQYGQAKSAVGNARSAYEKYTASGLAPYKTEYTKLNTLGAGNPTLDTLLGKITPYDPQASVDKMNAATIKQNSMNQLTLQRQQLNEDYTTAMRNADLTQSDSLRGLLSNYAGRGMAYSSGYGNAVGEQNRNYANYTGDLASGKQRGLAQADAGQAAAESNYLNMISQAIVGATGRLSTQAGKLGLGASDLPYYTELARRKLAAGGA